MTFLGLSSQPTHDSMLCYLTDPCTAQMRFDSCRYKKGPLPMRFHALSNPAAIPSSSFFLSKVRSLPSHIQNDRREQNRSPRQLVPLPIPARQTPPYPLRRRLPNLRRPHALSVHHPLRPETLHIHHDLHIHRMGGRLRLQNGINLQGRKHRHLHRPVRPALSRPAAVRWR